jgi:hypothetical protein
VTRREAVWVRRTAQRDATLPAGRYTEMALSPDGTRVAVVSRSSSDSTIDVWDFTRHIWVAHLTGQAYQHTLDLLAAAKGGG